MQIRAGGSRIPCNVEQGNPIRIQGTYSSETGTFAEIEIPPRLTEVCADPPVYGPESGRLLVVFGHSRLGFAGRIINVRGQELSGAECILDCGSWLGEGPLWSPDERCLYWTDMPACKVHRWSPVSGETRTWKSPEMVTAMSLRSGGGMIVAAASGIDFWHPETDARERVCSPEAALPDNRANDGKCDRQGRFWFGTMYNDRNPDSSPRPVQGNTGNLYRVDADATYHHWESGLGISNTFAWSPDETIMYFGDTFAGIYAYDFDSATGAIANRRRFAKAEDDAPGYCDGSTIDVEDFLWNARWDGGCIIRWAPDGTIDRRVDLPCPSVTSAIFGGDDLEVLYVTTARHGLVRPLSPTIPSLAASLRSIQAPRGSPKRGLPAHGQPGYPRIFVISETKRAAFLRTTPSKIPGVNSADPTPNPSAPACQYSRMPSGVTPPTENRQASAGNTARHALTIGGGIASAGNNFSASAPEPSAGGPARPSARRTPSASGSSSAPIRQSGGKPPRPSGPEPEARPLHAGGGLSVQPKNASWASDLLPFVATQMPISNSANGPG